jgi:hypothetical protein
MWIKSSKALNCRFPVEQPMKFSSSSIESGHWSDDSARGARAGGQGYQVISDFEFDCEFNSGEKQ